MFKQGIDNDDVPPTNHTIPCIRCFRKWQTLWGRKKERTENIEEVEEEPLLLQWIDPNQQIRMMTELHRRLDNLCVNDVKALQRSGGGGGGAGGGGGRRGSFASEISMPRIRNMNRRGSNVSMCSVVSDVTTDSYIRFKKQQQQHTRTSSYQPQHEQHDNGHTNNHHPRTNRSSPPPPRHSTSRRIKKSEEKEDLSRLVMHDCECYHHLLSHRPDGKHPFRRSMELLSNEESNPPKDDWQAVTILTVVS